MSLSEKILKLYPELTIDDLRPFIGTIVIQNDSDDRGDYIAKWDHPTLPRPTQEQLDGIE